VLGVKNYVARQFNQYAQFLNMVNAPTLSKWKYSNPFKTMPKILLFPFHFFKNPASIFLG
tara:strand:- start:1 stop:180 length:180 start_codon:yes stop_codon:yes gene_type:complete